MNMHQRRILKLYVGHKLPKGSPAFLQTMDAFRQAIEKELKDECVILKFLGLTAGTRGDVYDKDIDTNVATCDLFVAIVDEESTGLGMEIGAALWKHHKPALVMSSVGAHVSRLVGGAVDRNGDKMLERFFSNVQEAVANIREAIVLFEIQTHDDQLDFLLVDSSPTPAVAPAIAAS